MKLRLFFELVCDFVFRFISLTFHLYLKLNLVSLNVCMMSPVPVKKAGKRAQLSCNRCRLIKRKCDRNQPCGRCVEDEEQCSFDRAQSTQKSLQRKRQSDATIHTQSEASTSKSIDTTPSSYQDSLLSNVSIHQEKINSEHHALIIGDAEALRRLIAHPVFLQRVVHIYFGEIGWYTDLVSGTRLHRLVTERQDPKILGQDYGKRLRFLPWLRLLLLRKLVHLM